MIELRATKSASQRTKNRIMENGPFFEEIDSSHSVKSLNDQAGILVKSVSGGKDWLGWLPVMEVYEV